MTQAGITLTLRESCRYLAVHERTLRRLIARGALATTRQDIGAGRFRHMIERDELERLRAAGMVTPGRPQVASARLRPGDAAAAQPRVAQAGDETLAVTLTAAQGELRDMRDRLRQAEERELRLWQVVDRLALAPPAVATSPREIAGVRLALWALALAVAGAAISALTLRAAGAW